MNEGPRGEKRKTDDMTRARALARVQSTLDTFEASPRPYSGLRCLLWVCAAVHRPSAWGFAPLRHYCNIKLRTFAHDPITLSQSLDSYFLLRFSRIDSVAWRDVQSLTVLPPKIILLELCAPVADPVTELVNFPSRKDT